MIRKAHKVMYTCAHCGQPIYNGERSKVTTDRDGIKHWHYDHGLDCLAANHEAYRVMQLMEADGDMDEIDRVAERGWE